MRLLVHDIEPKMSQVEELCHSKPFVGDYIEPIISDFKGTIGVINDYSQELRSVLTSANNAMGDIVNVTNKVDTGVDSAQKYFIVCVWISSFFFVVVVAMMACCLLLIFEKRSCFTRTVDAIGWPLFSILLFLVWVFTSLFLAASLSGSDICVEPDEIVYNALVLGYGEKNTEGIEHTVYLNLVNYVMVRAQ